MYMEERSVRILELLVQEEFFVTVDQMAHHLGISRRSVYYAIDEANEWLRRQKLSILEPVRGKGYQLNANAIPIIQRKLTMILTIPNYSVQERQSFVLFALLCNQQGVMIEHLMNLVGVSRNTLFNDLKQIRGVLNGYGLDLAFSAGEGYQVTGDPIRRRNAYLFYHWNVKNLIAEKRVGDISFFVFSHEAEIKRIYQQLKKIEQQLQTEYVAGTLSGLSHLIHLILHVKQESFVLELNSSYIEKTQEYQCLSSYFPMLAECELQYLALHLLGSRTQVYTERVHLPILTTLAADLVETFERIAAIQFTLRTTLISQISSHLSVSYFRYHYGIHHGNPLLEQIKKEYSEVFELTNRACDVIRRELEVPVSEGEVAFLTLYFNSYLQRKNYSSDSIIVDIVCPSGIATSNMLRSEIEALHPQIQVGKIMNVSEYHMAKTQAQYVITTVDLSDANAIKVNAVLNNDDRARILNRMHLHATINSVSSLENIMTIISPYVEESSRQIVRQELEEYFYRNRMKWNTQYLLRLTDLLFLDVIQLVDQVAVWQEALQLASIPLIHKNLIQDTYVDAILRAIQQLGPYMVMERGYMLAHASYMDGVNKLGLSFLKLKQPVFIHDRKVDKIFVLAPVDQHQHLSIMKDILQILTSETLHEKLDRCNSAEEIQLCLFSFFKEMEPES